MLMFILFLLGTIIGSFLNVCIYRIPLTKSIVTPASFCPNCEAPVKPIHNLPIVSYLMLGGKCAKCGDAISGRYPIVETLTGLMAITSFLQFGLTIYGGIVFTLVCLLIVISCIDIDHFIIPNRILIIGFFLWVLFIGANFSLENLREAFIGSGLFAGFLYTSRGLGKLLFKKEALGLGDVKLAIVLGAFLGWEMTIVSLYAAFLMAAIYSIAGLMNKKVTFGQMLPFGPFLAMGSVISIFFGEEILTLFMRWIV